MADRLQAQPAQEPKVSEARHKPSGLVSLGDYVLQSSLLVNKGADYALRAMLSAARAEKARLEEKKGRPAREALAEVEVLLSGLKDTHRALGRLRRGKP